MSVRESKSIATTSLKAFLILVVILTTNYCYGQARTSGVDQVLRIRLNINDNWRFKKYSGEADSLIYDVRPEVTEKTENKVADAKPTEAVKQAVRGNVLKTYILPIANAFIKDPAQRFIRPAGNPGEDFPYVQKHFNDDSWQLLDLPHDWAIKEPFIIGPNPEVGGGMGRLPSHGVAWYRKKLDIPVSDTGKSIFLDIDGAMSYAMVWLNGHLVGGWPYGYNSWRLNLTPFILPGGINQLAIRLDNPNHSARWYPGGGIYRNVWLVKTNLVHVGQYGTYVTTKNISGKSAEVNIDVTIDNDDNIDAAVEVVTKIFELAGDKIGAEVGACLPSKGIVKKSNRLVLGNSCSVKNPKLWKPLPATNTARYMAITTILKDGKPVDQYETRFGIRSVEFKPNEGIFVNHEHIQIRGVNQHHDLGALGAAFNVRAAERQLEMLREMGCNAIRMSHNPPAPEMLELTDRMGFLVIDEIFDSWERKKTPHDFHLIFKDWSEADARAFVRRDRNHPSVVIWSFGNEIGEQYTGEQGAAIASRLHTIFKDEDATRPTMAAMNFAKPDMPLPGVLDIISLNYQGEGIRQAPEFEGTERIRTPPQYNAFHERFPDKVIFSSETASAFSSRGVYLFPVSPDVSAPVRDGRGGDSNTHQVSSYELHAVDFGASAEKVFSSLEHHPFVAGEFVWTGWDHLGEPTPYYESRSAYCGIIDLAGFRKDRFYLYQSHWKPDVPMAHILPHWNWPERIGKVTPVHVFTSGDEAELFLNNKSLGRKKKEPFQYRFRWDDVNYEPGELVVKTYKNGKSWAEDKVVTTGKPLKLAASADRKTIAADGTDLSFISVCIKDEKGNVVPNANNPIEFQIKGAGELVATDNGDPTCMTAFSSSTRNAFNGWVLAIVKSKKGMAGKITITATSEHLSVASIEIVAEELAKKIRAK